MLTTILFSPPLHGQAGIADELLLFCLPVVIAIIVLAITSRRARQKERRTRDRPGSAQRGKPDRSKSP